MSRLFWWVIEIALVWGVVGGIDLIDNGCTR